MNSFTKNDLEILRNLNSSISYFNLEWNRYNHLWYLFKQFIFLAKNLKFKNIIFIRMPGVWGILPIILNKLYFGKTILFLNGADSFSYPEINYGNLRKRHLRIIVYLCLKLSDEIWPVSKSLLSYHDEYFDAALKKNQGIYGFFPKLKLETKIVPEITNQYFFEKNHIIRNKVNFLTVAYIDDFTKYYLKGINKIIEIANFHNNLEFTIVGMDSNFTEKIISSIPKNLNIVSQVKSPEQLKDFYKNHKYYLQLSISEGFGVALCEAISAGCIPIVSKANNLPELIKKPELVIQEKYYNIVNDSIWNYLLTNKYPFKSAKEEDNYFTSMRNYIKKNNSYRIIQFQEIISRPFL